MVGLVFLAIFAAHHMDISLPVLRYRRRLARQTEIVLRLLIVAFLALITWRHIKIAYPSWNQEENKKAARLKARSG